MTERYSSFSINLIAANIREGQEKRFRSILESRFTPDEVERIVNKVKSDLVPDAYAEWAAMKTLVPPPPPDKEAEQDPSEQDPSEAQQGGKIPRWKRKAFIDWTDQEQIHKLFVEYRGHRGGLAGWHSKEKPRIHDEQKSNPAFIKGLEDFEDIYKDQMGDSAIVYSDNELQIIEISDREAATRYCKDMTYCVNLEQHAPLYFPFGPVYLFYFNEKRHYLLSPSRAEFRNRKNLGVAQDELPGHVLDFVRGEINSVDPETREEAYETARGRGAADYLKESMSLTWRTLGTPVPWEPYEQFRDFGFPVSPAYNRRLSGEEEDEDDDIAHVRARVFEELDELSDTQLIEFLGNNADVFERVQNDPFDRDLTPPSLDELLADADVLNSAIVDAWSLVAGFMTGQETDDLLEEPGFEQEFDMRVEARIREAIENRPPEERYPILDPEDFFMDDDVIETLLQYAQAKYPWQITEQQAKQHAELIGESQGGVHNFGDGEVYLFPDAVSDYVFERWRELREEPQQQLEDWLEENDLENRIQPRPFLREPLFYDYVEEFIDEGIPIPRDIFDYYIKGSNEKRQVDRLLKKLDIKLVLTDQGYVADLSHGADHFASRPRRR